MSVPVLDLTRQFRRIETEIQQAVAEVFTTQHFILGKHGKALEKEAAEHLGAGHAVGVASGTDALLLGLRVLGLRPGEGVITSPFTFFATAGAIHNAGGRPFFVDVDPETFNLSPRALQRFLEAECHRGEGGRPVHGPTGTVIRVLLPVHLYGLCCDMDALNSLAKDWGLLVLEDACQAYGSSYKGRRAGVLGDMAGFSFFPTKNLGGAGDGGLVTTGDGALAEALRMWRVHGSRERYVHETIGYNSRLDEVQAAVLRVKLRHVDDWNRERARVAERYGQALEGIPGVAVPRAPEGYVHIYHQYVIRTPERDALKAFLDGKGIGSMIYYPIPLHLQSCFRFLGYQEGAFPESEKAAAEVLALPVFAELREEEVQEVAQAIRDFHAGRR
ncbi:MAG: DegT/DnrJ/EryC1/StrS family aminotransferase [Acidobacteriota bacterium]